MHFFQNDNIFTPAFAGVFFVLKNQSYYKKDEKQKKKGKIL